MADAKNKRKLCDMDAEEFMRYGIDSDLSGEEEDCPVKPLEKGEVAVAGETSSQRQKRKSKSATHKDQLARLQGKDPKFFKFLQENDQELLAFDDSDTSLEGDEDDSDVEDEEIEKRETEDQTSSKPEEEEHDDDNSAVGEHPKDGILVTMEMIKQWRSGLEKHSLHSLKETLRAFRSAVHGALDMVEKDKLSTKLTFKVEGDTVFNAIIQLCLKHLYNVLLHLVGGIHNKHGKRILPSSHAKWSHVRTPVKHYLNDVLHLLRSLAEPTMLCVILRHAQQLIPYYACFPKIAKAFIKRSVRMWGSGEEHVRVLAFLGIRKVATTMPSSLLEFAMKQLYMNFVKNVKFTSPSTKPLIAFMQNSLVEMFSVDHHVTYQHAFVYIRQLAIHLRNGIVQKKKDSYQSVYNWQYIHCLHLWCRVVSEVKSGGILEPLIYPLVQTVIGSIKLVPTARFYPLRFHCVRSLNILSQATDTYIPVAPFLLEILESVEFNKKTKLSTAKPTDFSCILKVSKQHLATKPFQDAVMDHVFELLLEFFAIHAHSIAFPEITFPAVVRLRKFIKTTSVSKYRKLLKQLVDKIEETSTEVTDRRSKVSFSPKDVEDVERWVAQYRQHPNAIVKFYHTWKTMKPSFQQQVEEKVSKQPQDGSEGSSENETPSATRKKRHSSAKTGQKRGKDTTKKPKKGAKKPGDNAVPGCRGEEEDVVEDFQFSSEED